MDYEFFDCNCSIGRTSITHPGSFDSPEVLVNKMDQYGISKALVYHAVSRDHFPAEGNPLIDTIVRKYDNLQPVWVVMPHHTGEFPNPAVLINEMQRKGVKAVRIFPSPQRQNYSLKKYSAGSLFDMLEADRIPLFVDIDEIGWDNIDSLLSEYGNLPVILCNTGYRADRYIYPLMKAYGNLYIETSRYLSHLGLEALCSTIGSDRILFGTSMPLYTGSGAVFYIRNLMLPESDRRKIASGNLERLLAEVRL
ncbi:MAG: amidohydrolase family protein [Clostridia bacterium]|nr:amidohydrolase family protein [Clostridia bacterium]MBN2882763.1 amidohydrolase family protein [Clostridia bacterium]